MEQVSEKLDNFASSGARRSLVDDGDCPGSDDKEYATSGFYVREKTNDKESATNSSSNSIDGTEEDKEDNKEDDNQAESVTDAVALVNGETSEKMETEEEVIDKDEEEVINKDEAEVVNEDNNEEAKTEKDDVIEEGNKNELEIIEDKTEEEDVVKESGNEAETDEKGEAEVINEGSDSIEAEVEAKVVEVDKDKTGEKQAVEEVADGLEETTTNKISSTEEETTLKVTEQEESATTNDDDVTIVDEEKSSKDKEIKEVAVRDDEPMPLKEINNEKVEDKEVKVSDEIKNQEATTSDKKKDEEEEKHSSSTNTGTDYEDEDDFDPSLLCPDISMDIDEAPVVTNSQPPPATRDGSLSPLPYEPIFSTLVDEYTGTEIQVDLTPEEMELRRNMYKISNPVQSTKIHCTACNVHLGSALTGANNRFVHPLLKVLICKNCYHFYTSGEFEKDEDGSELYCRWCGQGGQVLCCSSCEFVFCKRCIRNNFGPKKFKQIRESDDWSCFRCDPGQLSYLRAACAEFIDYYKKESQRVHSLAGANPELMTTDYTKCCSKEKVEESKPQGQRPKRRRNNNEDSDPDYNVYDGGEPSSKRQHLSGSPAYNQLRTLAPKPSTATSTVAPAAQKSVIKTQIGSKTDPVRIRQLSNSAIRNVPPGFVARPGFVKLVPQQQQQRQPRPVAPPQQPRPPLSYTVVSGTTNGRPTFSSIRPPAKAVNQIPPMKHEWFEKTVRAAARVNSNLSYTLTQLNRQQSQANSVESLAVVHNKLQEVLSTSINSLIQVRKNLRTEFLVGIKSVKLPPKTPKPTAAPPPPAAVPDDDDVIFVSQPPPLVMSPSVTITSKKLPPKVVVNNNINKTLTPTRSGPGAKPIPSTSGAKPAPSTTNLAKLPNKTTVKPSDVKQTPPAPAAIGGPVKGGGFLKVRSLMALQSVPSECITIPDDPVEDPLKLTPPTMLPMLPMPHEDNRIEILDDESPVIIGSSPPPLAELSRSIPSPEMEMTFNLSKPLSPKVRKMMKAHVPLVKSPYLEQLLEKNKEGGVKASHSTS